MSGIFPFFLWIIYPEYARHNYCLTRIWLVVRDYRRKKASLLSFCFWIFLVLRYLCETFLKKSIYPTSSYLQKLEGGLDIEIPNLQVTFAPTNVSYSILIWKAYKKCIFISLSVYNRRLNLYINQDLQKNCSLSIELPLPHSW